MSKMYISCETLTDWFADYETNILLVDTSDKEESAKLRTINNAIVSAVRDMKKLSNEVTELIANGEVLQQGGGKRKGGEK